MATINKQPIGQILEQNRALAQLLADFYFCTIIPRISNDIYQQLGFETDFNDKTQLSTTANFNTHASWGTLPGKQRLGEPRPVFQKLELSETSSS